MAWRGRAGRVCTEHDKEQSQLRSLIPYPLGMLLPKSLCTALRQKPHHKLFTRILPQYEWVPSLRHLSKFVLCKVSFPSFVAKKFLVFTPSILFFSFFCFQEFLQMTFPSSFYIYKFPSLPVLKILFKKSLLVLKLFHFLLVYLCSSLPALSRQNSFTHTHTYVRSGDPVPFSSSLGWKSLVRISSHRQLSPFSRPRFG